MGCIECAENRIEPQNDCPCDFVNGYYSTGEAYCPPCHYKCETCVAYDTCSSCKDIRDILTNCDCPDGYYDDGTEICKSCDYKCSTCVDGTSCTACKLDANRGPVESFCPCLAGYYEEAEECKPCGYMCATCVQPDKCTSCK
jgi:proprotein convertase subtilisin/kexin type 5